MAIRKIVSRSIGDGAIGTVDLASGSLSSAGLDVTGAGGTGSALLPKGTTAQRPASPVAGYIRYNTTIDSYEQYTTQGWASILPPPSITAVTGTLVDTFTTTLTITGNNFVSGAVISITGNAVSGSSRNLTTTFVSSSQLTATTNASSVNFVGGATFGITVTNPNGLSGLFAAAGTSDNAPSWTTSAGSLGNLYDSMRGTTTYTVAATDANSNTITYSVASGSLPNGMSLNSSTGVISGTADAVVSDTTTSFTIRASTTIGSDTIYTDRAFSIARKAPVVAAFSNTGADQTFNVPSGLTKMTVKAWGAAGGGGFANQVTTYSGAGGFTQATLSWAANAVSSFLVGVGTKGYSGASGNSSSNARTQQYGGGGTAGFGGGGNSNPGGSGGGRSWLRITGGNADILTAGGGGGTGGQNDTNVTVTVLGAASQGGAGGGPIGSNGQIGSAACTDQAGKGGTQSAGGNGGTTGQGGSSSCGAGYNTTVQGYMTGSQYQGGHTTQSEQTCNGGGGGGGGYYGGGAGATWYGGGGGGGSSWVGQSVTANTTNTVNSGAGTTDYVNTSTPLTSTINSVSFTYTNIYMRQGNQQTPPATADANYSSGIAVGVQGGDGDSSAGNGRIVIIY